MLRRIDSKDVGYRAVERFACGDSIWTDGMLFVFYRDDTYSVFKPRAHYDSDYEIQEVTSCEYDIIHELGPSSVDLGLCNQNEFEEIRTHFSKQQEDKSKEYRRQEYERLKKEFEGNIGGDI